MFKQFEQSLRKHFISIFIILCGCIISFSILYLNKPIKFENLYDVGIKSYKREVNIKDEIILGNPNAKLFIVEYGDLQCPFCQIFHKEMKKFITGIYGINGDVAWVWRNGFHIDEISVEKARTLNCIKLTTEKYKSNEKSWQFLDRSIIVTQENLYPTKRYADIFKEIEIDEEKIKECRKNKQDEKLYQQDVIDVKSLNITKTPYIQFITKDGDLVYESKEFIPYEHLNLIVTYLLDESNLVK